MKFLGSPTQRILHLSVVLGFCGAMFVVAPSVAQAQTTTDELYISHYELNQANNATLRYDYSQTGTNAPTFTENEGDGTNTTPYLSGAGVAVSEGTSASQNQIFGVGGAGNNVVLVYDKGSKKYLGSINGFSSVGNIALSNDGKSLYVADESGSALYDVDLTQLASSNNANVSTPGLATKVTGTKWHDVTVDPFTGSVFASGYTDGANKGLYKFSSTLTNQTTFLAAPTTGGFTQTTIAGTLGNETLYVMNNQGQGNNALGSIIQATGVGNATATTSSTLASSHSLAFGFGLQNGPNGNLYAASLNGFSGGAVTDSSNISLVNTTTASVTEVISGTVNKPNASANKLVDPKYFVYGTANAIKARTTFATVPEPGTFGLIAVGLLGMVARCRRARK